MTLCTNIEIGKIYTADFGQILDPITRNMATDSFLRKYFQWFMLTGKRVLVLEKITPTSCPSNDLLKFVVLPINDPKQNKIDSTGEWCLCSANYLHKPQTQNHANCTCNLWTTGCVCGIFKTEQSKKK